MKIRKYSGIAIKIPLMRTLRLEIFLPGNVFSHALSMYFGHKLGLLGIGRSFDGKSHLDDLLNISDFSAGIVQDLLSAHKVDAEDFAGLNRKMELIKWLANKSKFLSKITIQIGKNMDGDLVSGLAEFHSGPELEEYSAKDGV